MNFKKGKIIMLIVFTVIALVFIASFIFMQYKDRKYFNSPAYTPKKDIKSDILVAYYSRSGNTEAMAREIAKKFNADILKIQAEKYSLNFTGWFNAARDARSENKVKISPETADLSHYRLIFLGSPIWLYRPAPPLLAFVEKNDFKDKKVILFNTFNSKFGEKDIDDFRKKIESKGGKFLKHLSIKRGRIIYQKSGDELIKEAEEIADSFELRNLNN